jgi:hypothetical protein
VHFRPRRIDLPDLHESIGLGIRQGSQQHAIDEAEEGRGPGNAERERGDGNKRRAGGAAKDAGGIAQIGGECVHEWRSLLARGVLTTPF